MMYKGKVALQNMGKTGLSLWADLFDLFYPRVCQSCDELLRKGEADICLQCIFQLPKTYYWDYDVNPLEEMFRGRLRIDGACSYVHFRKEGHVQRMIHRFKYDRQKEIGTKLATLFAHQLLLKQKYTDVDVIVPVPLHHTKLKRRGYNQSLCIARGMAEVLKCRVNHTDLIRKHATETQTRRTRYDRSSNVESVFECPRPDAFKGKCIMLVDDVVTTGSTIEATGRILLEAGVSKLYVVALASA